MIPKDNNESIIQNGTTIGVMPSNQTIDKHEIRVCGRDNRPKQNLFRQCQAAAKGGIEQYKP